MGINKVLSLNLYNKQTIRSTLNLSIDKPQGQNRVQIYISIVGSVSNMSGKQSEGSSSAQKCAHIHAISVDKIQN